MKFMKQILVIFGLAILLSGIFTSCKENSLEALRDNEIETLDKYVKDNNLSQHKDPNSAIYFWDNEVGTGEPINAGYMVMLQYKITHLDSTVIFSNYDENGYAFETMPFYVDISNDEVNESYVQQIAGMHVGLKKMRIGGRASMIIPSELAFKAMDYSSIGIPRFSTFLVTVHAKKGYPPAPVVEE